MEDTEDTGYLAEQCNPLEMLRPQQVTALEHLLTGARVGEAAQAAKVTRKTVSRWLHQDPEFQAASNLARKELRASHERRLESLASKALATVEQALDAGDVKTSLRVLEGLGFLNGEPPEVGSTRPATLEREHVKEVAHDLRQDAWAMDAYELLEQASTIASMEAKGAEAGDGPPEPRTLLNVAPAPIMEQNGTGSGGAGVRMSQNVTPKGGQWGAQCSMILEA